MDLDKAGGNQRTKDGTNVRNGVISPGLSEGWPVVGNPAG